MVSQKNTVENVLPEPYTWMLMKQNENLDNSKNDTWPLCEGE